MFWKKWFAMADQENANGTPMDIKAVVLSDIGCVRTNNEDNARFIRPSNGTVRRDKGFLAILADGMGGHSAGEIASQMAVDIIGQTYFARPESAEESLFLAFTRANRAIWMAASKNEKQRGMGTTCTCLAICNNQLFLAHVGDSRAYLLKKGQLTMLSKDHTYVQSLVDQGVISANEARVHPDKNILTRAMGTHNKVDIDVEAIQQNLEADDRILLCSDGLYDYLNDDEIARYMLNPNLGNAARAMIELAKQRGGHDNITVLLLEKTSGETFSSDRPTEEIE